MTTSDKEWAVALTLGVALGAVRVLVYGLSIYRAMRDRPRKV